MGTGHTLVPPRIFAKPMEGKFSRERRKAAEEQERQRQEEEQRALEEEEELARQDIQLERALAHSGWAYFWNGTTLEWIEDPKRYRGFKVRAVVDDPGPGRAEVDEAVRVACTSQNLGDIHDAATVLRDATALGDRAAMEELVDIGAVSGLVRMLEIKDPSLQEDAALSLLNMCHHKAVQDALLEEGVLQPLINVLVAAALSSTRSAVAAAIAALPLQESLASTVVTSGALQVLVDMLGAATQKVHGTAELDGGAGAADTAEGSEKGTGQSGGSSNGHGASDAEGSQSKTKEEAGKSSEEQGEQGGPVPTSNSSRTAAPPKHVGLPRSNTLCSAGDTAVRDACRCLLRLCKSRAVRAALLKLGLVPKLVDVAAVSKLVEADQEVAGLLALMVKAEGGAEQVCLANQGAAANVLVQLTLRGCPATQDLAVGALGQIAMGKPACCAAMCDMDVPRRLSSDTALENYSEALYAKVVKIIELMDIGAGDAD